MFQSQESHKFFVLCFLIKNAVQRLQRVSDNLDARVKLSTADVRTSVGLLPDKQHTNWFLSSKGGKVQPSVCFIFLKVHMSGNKNRPKSDNSALSHVRFFWALFPTC